MALHMPTVELEAVSRRSQVQQDPTRDQLLKTENQKSMASNRPSVMTKV